MDNNQWNNNQSYGQPNGGQYGQQPYGQQPYGQPYAPQQQMYARPKKNNTPIIIAICVIIVLSIITSIIVAGQNRKCEECGKKKLCSKYEVTMSYGGEKQTESGWLCRDCYKDFKEDVKEFEDLGMKVKIKKKSLL